MSQDSQNPVDESIAALIDRIIAMERRFDRLDTQLFLGEGCRVYHSADQATASGVGLNLTFDSERWDTDGLHDPVGTPTRLDIQHTGKYVIMGNVQWQNNGTGRRALAITVNGTIVAFVSVAAVNTLMAQLVTTISSLAQGDIVRLSVFQSSGGALNIVNVGDSSPEFMCIKVG